jgi:hypothetical protein
VETIEYRNVVDKTDWERGPWDAEVDKKQWRDDATGLPCLIVRGPSGALCGYVGVPEGHKWHGVHYDLPDSYIEVHGGLTFADGCGHNADPARGICHVPGDGEPDNVWWLGFDCAHSGDKANMSYPPAHRERFPHHGDIYRGQVYVERECARLAAQVAEAAS